MKELKNYKMPTGVNYAILNIQNNLLTVAILNSIRKQEIADIFAKS